MTGPRLSSILLSAVLGVVLAGSLSTPAGAGTSRVTHVAASGVFAVPAAATNAFTYDPALVPAGATARVDAWALPGGRTVVVLRVRGLLPDREYGAHAHSAACGSSGAAAGPHYQHVPDPVQPSVDPAYANGDNEIWLDLTTDAKGRGWAFAIQDWQPSADRRPGSVVLHAEHTHDGSDGGAAGTAGARLACLSVGF